MKSRIILLIAAVWLGCLSNASALYQYAVTVSNITDLQALSVGTLASSQIGDAAVIAPTAHVLGYYAPGDRGGGTFMWDPNSSGTPDGGKYIATNGWASGNGRWVRQLEGEVPNVKMWGAMGNIQFAESLGNVAAAHDDTTNIQNAINANQSGGLSQTFSELLIPAGWYKVSGTLILPEFVRLRGEGVRMCHLVKPYGATNDILHTLAADQAIQANDGQPHYGGPTRIEDLSFEFAQDTETGNTDGEMGHNQVNAAIVICSPEEGNTIRNIGVLSGGYGIRCLGDGGAVAAFRDVTFNNTAIAGICFEPVPGGSSTAVQVSIKGISGDHRWDESRSNACIVKFVNYVGPASVEDVNTEGIYGGGVISHQFPAALTFYDIGNLTLKNCFLNSGLSYSGLDAPKSFLTLTSDGQRTTAATMENIHLFGVTNLIRDELTERDVPPPDATALALRQAVVRLPLEYESVNGGSVWPDGVTETKYSRLVVGGQAIYSFIPPTTNAWYRILEPANGGGLLTGRVTVSSLLESSEFNVSIFAASIANAVELNVTRTTHSGMSPCASLVRAGSYVDSTGKTYPFVDIFVQRKIPLSGDNDIYQITVATPVYDVANVNQNAGMTYLHNPTTALSSIVPAGCTLLNCVTNSLMR